MAGPRPAEARTAAQVYRRPLDDSRQAIDNVGMTLAPRSSPHPGRVWLQFYLFSRARGNGSRLACGRSGVARMYVVNNSSRAMLVALIPLAVVHAVLTAMALGRKP